jgi:hypothetical protein
MAKFFNSERIILTVSKFQSISKIQDKNVLCPLLYSSIGFFHNLSIYSKNTVVASLLVTEISKMIRIFNCLYIILHC